MKRFPTFLTIREMENKTTMITTKQLEWPSPKSLQIINAGDINAGKKRIPLHHWWEGKLVQLLWRTVQRFLKKLKTELSHDPAISFLGIYLKKTLI